MPATTLRPDYGIDAPGVIRNLFLVAVIGLLTWVTAFAGLWSGTVGNSRVRIDVAHTLLWPGVACGVMAVWMTWHSKFGKVRRREVLFDHLQWITEGAGEPG